MKATDRPASRRLFKPAPPHNFMCDGAPARCMCVACCAEMVARRCTATHPTTGTQCGDYAKHRGEHSMIPATIFCIAEERIRLDGDQVERLLAKLEIPRNGFRLLDISISPVETHQTGRSVTFVLNERHTVNFHAPTLLEALRMADQAIWEAGCSATLLTPTDDTYEDSDPEC